ncbi:saccharopine dehydrogenase NADP-binding domain-containing protein [Paraglaciecola sp.]|uniref:saccharopine dehydrogenase family protein n=1 Tax=Paraglaciecola sp. TaxID=1920173 RepID=UPI0030F3AC70
MDEGNEQNTILVLGGYGAVGTAVCEELARIFVGRIVVAGRDIRRAELLANQLGERAEPVQLDAASPASYQDLIARSTVVINCVELNNLAVAKQCLANSVHYIDIAATAEILNQLQTLDSAAKRANATVVSSVGVAPGLTNLLAHHAQSRCGPLKHANIFVLLGLGESHGAAAIRWLLKQFEHTFPIKTKGGWREVSAFGEGLSTKMPEPFGRRKAYRFDFSVQHTLTATLEVESVSTWLCFDSRVATKVLWFISKLRLLSVLPLWRWSNAIASCSRWFSMGGTQFAVQVDAVGSDGNERSFTLVGDGEARTTGIVAAHVAKSLLGSSAPVGALHIEQLLSLVTLLVALDDRIFLTEA